MRKKYNPNFLCFFDRFIIGGAICSMLFFLDDGFSVEFFKKMFFLFFACFLSWLFFFISFARRIIFENNHIIVENMLKHKKVIIYSDIIKIDDQSYRPSTISPLRIVTKFRHYNIYPFFIKNSTDIKKEIVIRVKMFKEAEKEK